MADVEYASQLLANRIFCKLTTLKSVLEALHFVSAALMLHAADRLVVECCLTNKLMYNIRILTI